MRNRRNAWPWGKISGLMMALSVTLLGVVQGIEPLEILRRAFASFLVVAAVIGALTSALAILERNPTRTSR